jgi:hypothetical protein
MWFKQFNDLLPNIFEIFIGIFRSFTQFKKILKEIIIRILFK